jgi:sulfate transport system permease protein
LQTFLYVVLPSLRGALVTGALLTFARSIGEFGSTIMVSGNTPMETQTAPLYIYTKFLGGDVEGANAIAVVLAIISFAVFSLIIVFRNRLER